MKTDINICVDLGGDTMKIACAYKDGGEIFISRVVDPKYSDSGIPAIAYYDRNHDKWIYGYEIGRNNETSFSTVVKIKDILSFVYMNRNLYEKGHIFPYFDFPLTQTIDEKYYIRYDKSNYPKDKRERYDNMHFRASEHTPRSVCEGFFEYVVEIVRKFLLSSFPEFSVSENVFTKNKISYTLLYAPQIAKQKELEGVYNTADYTDEYKRLFLRAMRIPSSYRGVSLLSSAKALAMIASDSNMIKDGQSALLFDIGEEFVSVVKVNVDKIKGENIVSIDGVTGHNDPEKIGGNDIDKAIGERLSSVMIDKEDIGSGSSGDGEKIRENGLKSKNYLFLKNIKSAKAIFSSNNHAENFPNGVPVSFVRDVEVFKNLTRNNVCDWTGITSGGTVKGSVPDGNIAWRISDYICDELRSHGDSNDNVAKIYLCGGVSGTCGLTNAVTGDVAKIKMKKRPQVCNFIECFRDYHSAEGEYAFRYKDMYSFAPAIGGAISGVLKLSVKVLLTKTYATVLEWMASTVPQSRKSFLSVLVERGTDISFEKNTHLTEDGKYLEYKKERLKIVNPETRPMLIYSTNLTISDIKSGYMIGTSNGVNRINYYDAPDGTGKYLYMPYGDPFKKNPENAMLEREAEFIRKTLGINFVVGDTEISVVRLFYRSRKYPVTRIITPNGAVYCKYGVRIDREGNVIPFIESDEERNRKVSITVEYKDGVALQHANITGEDILVGFKSEDFRFMVPM